MAGVVWTPLAESDLDDILFYISVVDHRPATGEQSSPRFTIESRRRFHGAPGQRHPHAPEDWLFLRHKRWLICISLTRTESKFCVLLMPFVTYPGNFDPNDDRHQPESPDGRHAKTAWRRRDVTY